MNFSKGKNKIAKKLSAIGTTLTLIAIKSNMVFAESAGIGTAEVQTATDNVKRVITSIAMPLGGVLIFASIGSLAWICGGGVILGASLIIAGIIINIATNNSGNLLGS